MHCAGESELDIAVFWIGFINHLTLGRFTAKNNLLPINEIDGTSNFFGTDFPEEVFPLSKR